MRPNGARGPGWSVGGEWILVALCAGLTLFAGGCVKTPAIQRPAMSIPASFKEAPPPGWKTAQPGDGTIRGKWWEMFNDSALNALEEQVNVSNQNVVAAEAQYRAAKAAVRIARSALFPTLTTSPSMAYSQGSARAGNARFAPPGPVTSYDFPFTASYEADVWGAVRRQVSSSAALAQASEAQWENVRLLYQTQLASDYFQMHGLDGDCELLEKTVQSYQEYLKLTRARYDNGIASDSDVAQAETQLFTTQASLQDVGVARAQFEHAIAMLVGKAPADVTIPAVPLQSAPPPIPVAVPSALLERRPDIAGNERQVASANELIGVAKAAFFPTITLSATGGFQSGSFLNWLTWPSRFWSLGPQFAEVLFDAGKRHAQVQQAQAQYDVTAANYRETVLTAFQEVEDNLAALRILETESATEQQAVASAERALKVTTDQYNGGIVTYLQVITTQTAALNSRRAVVSLLSRRMTAAVQLVQALGGGWDVSQLK
jgi:NodT family efflux transporter outer membrane factor (OMF) lipoprotein